MKKTILFLALATAFVACEKNEKLDPNAKISIKPATKSEKMNVMKIKDAKFENFLSDLDIVKKAQALTLLSYSDNGQWYEGSVGFAGKDTVSSVPKLLIWGTWVISDMGKLQEEFLKGYDMVLYKLKDGVEMERTYADRDTIAYIPNAQVRDAEEKIRAAWAVNDYNSIYSIFDNMFTFTKITGEQWRDLKSRNEQ